MDTPSNIQIIEDRLEDALKVSMEIPEFENPYSKSEYEKRLIGVKNSILTAYINNKPIGFKIGYERIKDGSFYSWMGGVLPQYRKLKVASKLADYQETWAKENGYKSIHMKTRLKHQVMLSFSLKRNFIITDRIPKIPSEESRIVLEKSLTED